MLVLLLLGVLHTQSLVPSPAAWEGVWQHEHATHTERLILQDRYAVWTRFSDEGLQWSRGGPYIIDRGRLIWLEAFRSDGGPLGLQIRPIFQEGDRLLLDGPWAIYQARPAYPSPLEGLWKMAGRQDGETFNPIQHTGGRRTLKVLSAGHFQWFAIDPDKQVFYATGGGNYHYIDGAYQETIDYFSRDPKRAGAKLRFQAEVLGERWHHKGTNSQGEPMHEVWQRAPEEGGSQAPQEP